MSHFAVLVVTPNGTDEERTALLAPFHEFECTGIADEYVQDVDITQEARDEFATKTTTFLVGPDGERESPYENRFYRDPTPEEAAKIGPIAGTGFSGDISYTSRDWGDGKGYRSKIKYIPEGWTETELPFSEVQSFAEWVESWHGMKLTAPGEQPDLEGDHKYGYVLVDEAGEVVKVINRTNPDKKWDWWVLGGRYSGRIKVKPGVEGVSGRRSWANDLKPGEPDPAAEGWVDSARKSDIDFESMGTSKRQDRFSAVTAAYDKIAEATGLSRDEITAEWARYCDALKLQRELWEQDGNGKPFYQHLQEVEGFKELRDKVGEIGEGMFSGAGVPDTKRDPFAWVEETPALTTWAFLGTDGVWREKGSMGWFGMSSGDMDPDDWDANVRALIDAIPDDHHLSFVDCHI